MFYINCRMWYNKSTKGVISVKARLIKNPEHKTVLLLEGGAYIEEPDISMLSVILFNFKTLEDFKLERNATSSWKTGYPAISSVPGVDLAYVTDYYQLVVEDISPFVEVFEAVKATVSIEEALTISEYAKKYNRSLEQIKVFCRQGRIFGAKKVGRDWLIPANSPYPVDTRRSINKFT